MRKLSVVLVFVFVLLLAGNALCGCPPYDEEGKTFDANPIVDAIDTNGDDKMTYEEWTAAEAPEPSWNMFNGNEEIKAQGYITREQFVNEAPPDGIDTDCDGFITLEEFLATKNMNMGGGGGPGGGGPGGGGPPEGGAPPGGGAPPQQ